MKNSLRVTRFICAVIGLASLATFGSAEADGFDLNHYILGCGDYCPNIHGTAVFGGSVDATFTGAWYDPAQSGQGLFLEVLPDHRMMAFWFTFNPDGTQQAWLVGTGTYAANVATIDSVVMPTGGAWIPNFDATKIVDNAWGSMSLTFDGYDHGKVEFKSVLGYGTGSMNLTRLTRPARSWVATGNLNIARTRHTATLLADGKVLVVGGWGWDGAYVPGAELYDPTTGIWTLTGDTKCTAGDTATLLFDGRVLIAGGGCEELYDPVTGTFTLTGGMNEWRIFHTATRLADGRVLVAGGAMDNWDGTPIGSAEIYDPATGRWTLTGALGEARYGHTATMLRDGRVLVLGYSSAELYDPNAGIWKNAGALALPRNWHQATLLPSGKVLVTDGEGPGPLSVRDSELFDPATGTSTVNSGLNVARAIATVTLLQSGDVLVAGGVLFHSTPTLGNAYAMVASAAKYDSTSAQWQLVGAPITPRFQHTATLLQDGRVLVAGGSFVARDNADNAETQLASAELYGNFPAGTIDPRFTGSWFDPTQNGHGLLVEVLPNSQFLAAWFAFNPGRTAQAWFMGVGNYSGNTATISSVVQPTGGRWIPNFDASRVVDNPWGTLKFTFTDCNHGKVEFASTAGYGTGSMNLTRLTQPAGLTCP